MSMQLHLGGGVGGAGGKGGQSGGAGGKGGGPDLSPLAHWGGFASSIPNALITAGGGRGGAGGHGGQRGGGGGFGGGVLMPNLPPQQLNAMFGGIGATPHSKPARAGCAIPGVPQDKQFLLAFPTVPIVALGLSAEYLELHSNTNQLRCNTVGELLKLQMDSAMQLKGAYGGYVARSMEIVNSGSDEPPPYPSY
ncbi:hypothetical protein R3P38DRAFT_3170796 [Favolaschia claudopus]|uniref:Uncharacterized protein n=1 Tax=Favolaschia claudopus TaxID=2862362 RepID=A0AAW0DUQ1_9AGAR